MLVHRSLAPLAVIVFLAGCASMRAHEPAATPDITFDLSASPERARNEIAAAFAANGLPIATSQPGVVEYHGARERGILGYYEVFARAVIVPLDCGTRITMFGEETKYPNATSLDGTPTRIGPSSTGRARDVWAKMQLIAGRLRGDSLSRVRTH